MTKQMEMVLDVSDVDNEELRLDGVTTCDITLSNKKKYAVMVHSSKKIFFSHFNEEFKEVTGVKRDVLYMPHQGDIILDNILPEVLTFIQNDDSEKQTFVKTDLGYLIWIPLKLSFNLPKGEEIKEFSLFTIIREDDPFYMDIECAIDKNNVDFTFEFIARISDDFINNRTNTATMGDIASVLGYYEESYN